MYILKNLAFLFIVYLFILHLLNFLPLFSCNIILNCPKSRWGRRGGSNSDSESPVDEEGTHAHQSAPSQQPNSTEYSSGVVSGFGGNGHEYRSSGQMSGSSIFQNRYPNLSNEVSHAVANATPSPQLSLAEFLHTE